MENSAGSHRFAAQLIFIGFGILSWWTTGAGLAVLTGMPIFAYAISVLIQGLLALTALKLFSEYGLKRGIALILYLLTATVSIAFSISFWFSLFSAQEYADHLFNQQYETVYKNAKQLQYTYKQENTALNILAKQAAVIARKEIKSGGTCRRGSQSGMGPLASKRIYQAETFLNLSQAFGAPINAIDAQMNAIRKIKHSTLPVKERLNKLQEAASNLNVQIKQSQIYKKELMHHLKWEKNGYPAGSHSGKYDFSGSQYACSEISIIAPIKRLLIAWPEQIPAIQVFDPNDKKTVITKIAMSLSTLVVPLKHRKEDAQSVFDRQYILPFFMGFLVDVLILFGAFLLNNKILSY